MKIIKNFFDENEYESINKENLEIFNSKKTKKNSSWNFNVKEFSKEVKVYSLDKDNLYYNVIAKSLIKHKIYNVPIGISFYYWPPGSYIPWHNDGMYAHALTIYLNEDWNYLFGGLFQYNENNIVKTIIPKKNLAILQVGGLYHSTTISSYNSPLRRSIQIFFEDSISGSKFESKKNSSLF